MVGAEDHLNLLLQRLIYLDPLLQEILEIIPLIHVSLWLHLYLNFMETKNKSNSKDKRK